MKVIKIFCALHNLDRSDGNLLWERELNKENETRVVLKMLPNSEINIIIF